MTTFKLYPELNSYAQHLLQIDDLHQIFIEECGNPAGTPVVFLHGGPGSGCNPGQRRFFDPDFYRIILFDQRGCGRSLPAGETRQNNTDLLVSDIEAIRQHLNITQWHVFGGSWGSSLALAYAVKHYAQIKSLILRGIFLSRQEELDWFLGQVRVFFPEAWQNLIEYLPSNERHQILQAFQSRVFNEDEAIAIPAAIHWNAFESTIMSLLPPSGKQGHTPPEVELARARVQIHYILNLCFIGQRDLLSECRDTLSHIPTTIVQGRYDMVCPPQTAYALAQAMPHAHFVMVPDAGHSAMEPGTASALVEATIRHQIYSA